jgi:hypothetical protein
MKGLLPVALVVLALLAPPAFAKSGSQSGSHHRSDSSSTYHAPKQSRKASGVPRDSKGRIQRSPEAKHEFRKSHPCPSTGRTSGRCPGFVVDHVQALKHGGADAPSNMQWQSKEAAKAKDRVE